MCIIIVMMLGGNTLANAEGNSADAGAEATSTFNYYNTEVSDRGLTAPPNTSTNRQFVNPGITPLPQTNGFFTSPTPDSSFRSVKDFLNSFVGTDRYTFRLTEGALENLAKGGDVKPHLQALRSDVIYGADFKDDIDNPRWLWVGIEAPVFKDGKQIGSQKIKDLLVTGMIDGEAKDGDTNSLQVLGQLGLDVLASGCNYLILTAEGAHRKVEASGWGVGLYLSGGNMASDGMTSGIIGGGTGYSQNETGPEDRPWIQGYFGVKADPKLDAQIAEFNAKK